MAMKRWMLILLLLLVAAPAQAREEGRTYVIRKGDTLWGISERFLTDPYYWPSLWSHNPSITNPHFIYPGQQIRIYDGRLELIPVRPEASPATAEAAAPAPPPPSPAAEAVTIKVSGKVEGFIAAHELDAAGVIVDAVDSRIMLAEGDTVFVEMANLAAARPNDRYSLVKLGEEVLHPVTGGRLGYKVIDVGELTITQIHQEAASALITDSTREVQRGTRLLPWLPPVRELTLKKARQPLAGYLVAGGDGRISLGQHDIIYVDLGAVDGLEAGNILYLSRPRPPSEFSLREDLQLPDVLLGSAVVIDIGPETASALVLKSVGPLHRGDRVTAAVE